MKTSKLTLNLPAYIALTIALVAVNLVKSSECPEGWAERLSRCYYFSNTTTDWFSAWQACGGHRAHLLSIESNSETNNVLGYINLYTTGKTSWWTSGCNDNENGAWGWYGTMAPVVYENACTDEMILKNSTADVNHCIALNHDCGYAWVAQDCTSTNLRYICEKDAILQDVSQNHVILPQGHIGK